MALQQTSVTSVTIISRVEPALIMGLSILFLGEEAPLPRSLNTMQGALTGELNPSPG
jgi:uncharacterized membrane protein